MKKISLFWVPLILFTACKKEENIPQSSEPPYVNVKVMLDYLGTDGYYNDNIEGIPSGLTVGASNGPYKVTVDKTYTIEYKASSSFPVLTYQTNFGGGVDYSGKTWVIHCYVSGNVEHIEVQHE